MITLGAKAFHRLFTCSEFQGLRFCGMVEEPTWSLPKDSLISSISEHQRDLTNSASERFVSDFLAGFSAALNRMKSVLAGLQVNRAAMAANLARAGDLAFSEAVYVLAARGGDSDAHERVRRATLRVEREGLPLRTVLAADAVLWRSLDEGLRATLGCDAATFFDDPSRYAGRAASRALAVADTWDAAMTALRKELST